MWDMNFCLQNQEFFFLQWSFVKLQINAPRYGAFTLSCSGVHETQCVYLHGRLR